MNSLFIPASFEKGRVPTVQKVIRDGAKMYQFSRYVIVLDAIGNVIESFENYSSTEVVDCLVVLAPCVYKGASIDNAIALEIGFRRFVPYKQAEYRLPITETTYKICAIKDRLPVISLAKNLVLAILPELVKGIQRCVDSLIGTWQNSTPIQIRENKNGDQYTYIASIFARIPKQERLLCAAARFKETEFRLSKTGPLATLAKKIQALCREFIAGNKRSKTEQGDYLQRSIKKSHTIWLIEEALNKRIKYRKFTEQMIYRMLILVGKRNSPERKLLDQVFKVRAIAKPVKDIELEALEKEFGHSRKVILAKWSLTTFVSIRHASKRTLHASDCLTVAVLGSHKELEKMIQARDNRRVTTYVQGEEDAEIPF